MGIQWGTLVSVLTGVLSTLALQLVIAHLTARRERAARIFDARRQVYVQALREVNRRVDLLPSVDSPELAEEIRISDELTTEVVLLGSRWVYESFLTLATALNDGAEHLFDTGELDDNKLFEMIHHAQTAQVDFKLVMRSDLDVVDRPARRRWARARIRVRQMFGLPPRGSVRF